MRGCMLFVVGILVGLGVQSAVAQNQNSGLVGLNHVGINVPDMDEALAYYTGTLGFPEAFRVADEQGQPRLVYVQISKNTFVELQPANGRPEGVSHFGLHVEDMDAATAMFKQRGATVSEIRGSDTNAILSNITEVNGLRIELAELPPESLHRQAMERWE
jgi:catechol 2,3-dioxygenase-like lactoylglutathione lyase family enzyme